MAKTDDIERKLQLALDNFKREYRNECLHLKMEISRKDRRIKELERLLDGKKGSEDEEL